MTKHVHSHEPHGHSGAHNLKWALLLTTVYMFSEFIGGLLTNSLALIADAWHMLVDVSAMIFSLLAFKLGSKKATAQKTFGYYHTEVLAAFLNSLILLAVCAGITYEAITRLITPEPVQGLGLIGIALGGLVINLFCLYLISGDHSHNLNMRGAWLHIIGDMLGSVVAIVAGLLIWGLAIVWADAVGSIIISAIISYGALKLLRDSTHVLLNGTPANVSILQIAEALTKLTSIEALHDLHVWQINQTEVALSAHIVHSDRFEQEVVLKEVTGLLAQSFAITHTTIQLESTNYGCEQLNCFES